MLQKFKYLDYSRVNTDKLHDRRFKGNFRVITKFSNGTLHDFLKNKTQTL